MVIKDKFRLMGNVDNVISMSKSQLKRLEHPDNTPRHVYSLLQLKRSQLTHFSAPTIIDWVHSTIKTNALQVVSLEKYPLSVTYNKVGKQAVINLNVFDNDRIVDLTIGDFYALLVYAYSFQHIMTGKFRLPPSYASIVINYLLSFFVQVFGKDYGLVSIYSRMIPKLKFLIACYVLNAFFGYNNRKELFLLANKAAPYLYKEEIDKLEKYDFSGIEGFVRACSDLDVMPGLTLVKFTSKLYRLFGIHILPAMEDVSRFFSTILVSSVSGNSFVPRLLLKFNPKMYMLMIQVMMRMF